MKTQRRFIIGLTAIGCAFAIFYLLWNRQFPEFWTVLIGAAYFYIDKVAEKEKTEDE